MRPSYTELHPLKPGGLDAIRKEAWPFYRTSSGVRLCWVSKNLKDLKKDLKDLGRDSALNGRRKRPRQVALGLRRPAPPRVRRACFRLQGSGCRVQGSGFRVQGSGFRIQGSGFRVQGLHGYFAHEKPPPPLGPP